MAGWVGQSVALMKPLAKAIGKHVRSGAAIHADDTHVPVLSTGNGKTKTGRIWTYVRDERPRGSDVPPAAYYRFSMDGKGMRPAEYLADYSGFMHADAYAGFAELYRSGKITAFGWQSRCDCLSALPCMAHIRREFFDKAQSNGTSTAIEALARIAQLYAVEAKTRGKPPDERAAIRQA